MDYLECNGDVLMVTLPNVHWCDGELLDLQRIGQFCADHNIGPYVNCVAVVALLRCGGNCLLDRKQDIYQQEIQLQLLSCW